MDRVVAYGPRDVESVGARAAIDGVRSVANLIQEGVVAVAALKIVVAAKAIPEYRYRQGRSAYRRKPYLQARWGPDVPVMVTPEPPRVAVVTVPVAVLPAISVSRD